MVEHDTICKKGLYALYYAFYVIIEGIFKVSHSWNPIISIAGIISLLVALPLINITTVRIKPRTCSLSR